MYLCGVQKNGGTVGEIAYELQDLQNNSVRFLYFCSLFSTCGSSNIS